MNESYFESRFVIFNEKPPFWAIFWHFSYSTSINDPLTVELNYLLNWISIILFNWIILWIETWVKQYWIKYWMNQFWQNSKIELNQIGYRTPLSDYLQFSPKPTSLFSQVSSLQRWIIHRRHNVFLCNETGNPLRPGIVCQFEALLSRSHKLTPHMKD